jgi:glyoxylase-like metal-dependent hydrolase (beta-lactamase superfamily II)
MSFRIHHLNCISTCPLGGALMDGKSMALRGRLACHCLLIETPDTLVLIDTGFGTRDVQSPRQRLSGFFLGLVAPEFRDEQTAIRQIERLGYKSTDVRHIVLTHLDFDHAGGIDDFPHAMVHVMAAERDMARARPGWLDRQRYRPQQWGRHLLWNEHRVNAGESWFGFEQVRDMQGLPPELLMIPLIGHTVGHAGVAIRTDSGWLLQAGDAYFYHEEMNLERPHCTPGLRFYQWMLEQDRDSRLLNQHRLRELKRAHGNQVRILSSHDVLEFEHAAHRPLGAVATAV